MLHRDFAHHACLIQWDAAEHLKLWKKRVSRLTNKALRAQLAEDRAKRRASPPQFSTMVVNCYWGPVVIKPRA